MRFQSFYMHLFRVRPSNLSSYTISLPSRAQQLSVHGRQPQDRAAASPPREPRGGGRHWAPLPPLLLPAVGGGPGPPEGPAAGRPQRGGRPVDAER